MSKPSRKNRSKTTDQVHEESLTIEDGVDELEQEGDGDQEYVYEMMKMQESYPLPRTSNLEFVAYFTNQLSLYICFLKKIKELSH